MFGRKNFGMWEDADQNGAVNNILKSWFPLIAREGTEAIIEKATGNIVGKLYLYRATPTVEKAIERQISILYPEKEYSTVLMKRDKKTGVCTIVDE